MQLIRYAGWTPPRGVKPKTKKEGKRRRVKPPTYILAYCPSGFTPDQYDKVPIIPNSLKKLLFEICMSMNVLPNDVVGLGRVKILVAARKAFVRRARDELKASFTRIGKCLNRDHTTAVYAYYGRKRVKEALDKK